MGPVDGLDLVHLQCHFGLDTLSWARLGARVTGLDFSPNAVDAARRIASDVGIDADFVCAERVRRGRGTRRRQFDVVYTGLGALCWLPDIDRWAAVVDALARPGGLVYVPEFHPIDGVFGDAELIVKHPYFGDPEGGRFDDRTTYTDPDAVLSASTVWDWNHPVSAGAHGAPRPGAGARVVPRVPVHALPAVAVPRPPRRRDLPDARGHAVVAARLLPEAAQTGVSEPASGRRPVPRPRGTAGRGRSRRPRSAALAQVTVADVEAVLHAQGTGERRVLATGLAASPGVASGVAVFDAWRGLDTVDDGHDVILVRPETSPADEPCLSVACGVLTSRGGMASHAAVIARGRGLPAVCGAESLVIGDDELTTADGVVVHEGDLISIDGSSGEVLLGALDVGEVDVPDELHTVLGWADEVRAGHLGVLRQRRHGRRRGGGQVARSRGHRPLSDRAPVPRTRSPAAAAAGDPVGHPRDRADGPRASSRRSSGRTSRPCSR